MSLPSPPPVATGREPGTGGSAVINTVINTVTLLSGGVGGAKLALGLYSVLPPGGLTVIANSGDDLSLFGLRICPDADILAYTLAGLADTDKGWGLRDDSFRALERVRLLGGTGWFNLGDMDIGLALFRTELLAQGMGLAAVTGRITAALGLHCTVLPMSEQPVETWLDTDRGPLHLQEYMVRERTDPVVEAVRFTGVASATPAPGVIEALGGMISQGAIRAAGPQKLVILAPSNPLISIGPILAVPGVRAALRSNAGGQTHTALRVGVSPVVGGASLKGPTDRMLAQLGHEVSAVGVARLYADLLDVYVIDEQDAALAAQVEDLGLRCVVLPTVMHDLEAKRALARGLLALQEDAA